MGKNDTDLFGDSSSDEADTDDLIAAAKSQPIAKKRKGGEETKKKNKKNVPVYCNYDCYYGVKRLRGGLSLSNVALWHDDVNFPDADNDPDSDEEDPAQKDDDDDAAGLFDSSSEDEDDGKSKRKASSKKKKKLGNNKKKSTSVIQQDKRSKKERMDALAKKRHADDTNNTAAVTEPRTKRSKKDKKSDDNNKSATDGNASDDDSYNSATFQRTKDDDDFIDADDEDPDALKELYAEQHFDDERPDGSDSENDESTNNKKKKKKSSSGRTTGGGGLDKIKIDEDITDENADATSALVMAVKRMAKKKKNVKKLPELELEATEFLKEMDAAADDDDVNISNRKPATKKLAMLPRVLEMLARQDLQRPFLDLDLLSVLKRWVQPLPSGKLGNVTQRKAVFDAVSGLSSGENGINSSDLKRSGFGKVTMALYMHKDETPAMKKLLKSLIDQWSRPIFQKSGDMRDLEKVQAARARSNEGFASSRNSVSPQKSSTAKQKQQHNRDDLAQIITEGSKNARDNGNNRVRVPYSKGFQYTVRPTNRTGDVSDKRNLVSASSQQGKSSLEGDKRAAIAKRMLEKNRPMNKQNVRSANISIEGRATK
eukprot:scaffold77950_cov72-Cyclotella_meneghiniana.AAC.1